MIFSFKGHGLAFIALATFGVSLPVARAGTLFITPTFDTSITSNANAANIEGSINAAISAITSLYATPTVANLTVPVTFTYNPAVAGDLLSTNETFYSEAYPTYVAQLTADSIANPLNTALATALGSLSLGNDSGGGSPVVLSGALISMLSGASDPGNAVININSNVNTFGYTQPVSGSDFDLTGGLEHELDEVLGGGGAGSTLNAFADSGGCNPANPGYAAASFFCGKFGPLDLYRYTAASGGTKSYNDTDPIAYFSINGDVSSIVGFNNVASNGDMADFAPSCGPNYPTDPEYIQNAQNCPGPNEAYTNSSPEFTMLESIGWDPTASSATPEPGTFALFGASIVTLAFLRRRYRRK